MDFDATPPATECRTALTECMHSLTESRAIPDLPPPPPRATTADFARHAPPEAFLHRTRAL